MADAIESAILDSLPATYGRLVELFNPGEGQEVPDRKIDKALQRLRRRGAIEWKRVNGRVTWMVVL